MRGLRQENCRIGTNQDSTAGLFLLPRQTPPFPLAFLLPNPEGRTPLGDSQAHPRLRPEWELSWALGQSGIASFAFCCPREYSADHLKAAWKLATQHQLLSKSRLGMVALGAAGQHVAPLLAQLEALDLRPKSVVFGGCGEVSQLAGPGPVIPEHRIQSPLIDSGPNKLPSAGQAGQSVHIIEDLTSCLRRHSDQLAHRSMVHPGLIAEIVTHLSVALLPSWEQAVRAPGVAIGESADR